MVQLCIIYKRAESGYAGGRFRALPGTARGGAGGAAFFCGSGLLLPRAALEQAVEVGRVTTMLSRCSFRLRQLRRPSAARAERAASLASATSASGCFFQPAGRHRRRAARAWRLSRSASPRTSRTWWLNPLRRQTCWQRAGALAGWKASLRCAGARGRP